MTTDPSAGDGLASPESVACPGPFIWYPCFEGAVLYCAACGHLTVTCNWNEPAHANTPILLEGLAS